MPLKQKRLLRHWGSGMGVGVYCLLILAGCNGLDDMPFNRIWGTEQAALVNGDAVTARFSNPVNVEVAADGTVYVADFDNDAVRMISSSGAVSTLVRQSTFSRPFGLALAADGTLYVQTDANDLGARDSTTGTIWRVNPGTGAVAVVARNLGRPRGIQVLADGRIAMSDVAHHVISILDPATGSVTPLAGAADEAGFEDATGAAARFNRPYGLARLSDGALLVACAVRRTHMRSAPAQKVGPWLAMTIALKSDSSCFRPL